MSVSIKKMGRATIRQAVEGSEPEAGPSVAGGSPELFKHPELPQLPKSINDASPVLKTRRIPRALLEDSSSSSSSSAASVGGDTVISIARNAYTPKEDATLAKYIRDRGLFAERKGRALWQDIAAKEVLPERSWQSMKNRFLKTIVPRLGRKYFTRLSKAEEEGARHMEFVCGAYTMEEDVRIATYIAKNHRQGDVGGTALWKLMEERDVCTSRTWQSMKERYLKRIRLHLDRYDDIDPALKIILK